LKQKLMKGVKKFNYFKNFNDKKLEK